MGTQLKVEDGASCALRLKVQLCVGSSCSSACWWFGVRGGLCQFGDAARRERRERLTGVGVAKRGGASWRLRRRGVANEACHEAERDDTERCRAERCHRETILRDVALRDVMGLEVH